MPKKRPKPRTRRSRNLGRGRRESTKVNGMPSYTEYLNMGLGPAQLTAERKKQLERISQIRGRDVLVYAASLLPSSAAQGPLTSINYEDLLPLDDQLSTLSGNALDLIIESPGGAGEVAEDIVRRIRNRYSDFAVIVPGWAKSAATLIAMAAGELLMGRLSALGPIDAQIQWQGKVFSADALLEGMEKIKREVLDSGILNKAYIPMLQAISPGELQSAENALAFAKKLVTDWLAEYKFAAWHTHSSTGHSVTPEDRTARASEIAAKLCDHRKWLTHGRSIRIDHLRDMKLQVTDYATEPDLNDAISRYYTLLQMTFASNIYKLYETAKFEIMKMIALPVMPGLPAGLIPPSQQPNIAHADVRCDHCGQVTKVQASLDGPQPLQPGSVAFPSDSRLHCPKCKNIIDLQQLRRMIEQQSGRKIAT